MARILIPPSRVPVVDGAGNATVPWYTFFAQHLQAQADLPAGQITVGQVAQWDLAHGWGNHALAGYLSEETDPVFAASDAAAISSADIADWHAAYSWGDHALAGYLTSDAEGSITADAFTGDGLTTAYTLSRALSAGGGAVVVAVDGVVQAPATYAVSGMTLTFSEAPPAGSVIDMRVLGTLVAAEAAAAVADAAASAVAPSAGYVQAEAVQAVADINAAIGQLNALLASLRAAGLLAP